jgi:hypothetical protein
VRVGLTDALELLLATAMKIDGTSLAQSRNALVALCYIANIKRDIVQNNLALLTTFGLGERWKEDERIAQYTCLTLQKLVSPSFGMPICLPGVR